MFYLNKHNHFGSKCSAILALVLIVILFIAPIVNAVTVTASYSTGGGGGGGSPPPAPPTPPPTPPPPADTTPPVISSIIATDITSSSARITWNTDEAATSVVNYGLSSNYGTTTTVAGSVISHSVTISGLTATTVYNFRVRSVDASSNEAVSANQTFTTLAPDTAAPIISNITLSQITGTSAQISWDTNEPATGKIDYGLTASYGLGPILLNTLALSQNSILSGLSSETDYHFQITATDSAGNVATSADQIFRTSDITAPIISGLAISNIAPTSATVSWATNEPASSELTFSAIGITHTGVKIDSIFKTNPSFSLTSLLPNTTYQITAKAKDASGNQTVSSPSQFQTLPDTIPPANVVDLVLTVGNESLTLSWNNPTDADFAGVKILRKISGTPSGPFDGTIIFNGVATSYPNLNLTNGVTYYYGVFAYDTSDNFASGAIISGKPAVPSEILPPPPPPPGEEPPSTTPDVLITPPATTVASTTPIVIVEEKLEQPAEERLTLDDVKLLLANRTIEVPREQFSEVHSLPGSSLGIIISPVVVTPIKSMILSLGGNTYLLRHEQDGTYQGDFMLPAQTGLYPVKLLVSYSDNKEELLEFNIAIDLFGSIFEKIGEQINRLPNVKVTLFEIINGEKIEFDAAKFNQLNPILTNQSGAYGFIVPPGTYVLRIELENYRSFESNKFEVKNFVVNRAIELLPLPKTVLETVPFVGKIVAESITEFINNSDVQKINTVVAPTITTVATVNTVAAVSVVNFGQYFWYLLTQPFILLRRRKYRKWGMVYDALKKLPIDLAVVRLYEQYLNPGEKMKRWRLISTQVTDKQGRFLFLAKLGAYHIQVAKAGFRFPSNFLQNIKEDRGFTDIYHGETFEVAEEKVLTYNIPLDSEIKGFPIRQFSWQELAKGFQNGISFGGIALMGASYAISPRIQNLLFLIANLALFLLFSRLAKKKIKGKSWGAVSDATSGKTLAGVTVRLFDQQFNKLVATTTADAKGRYSFLAGSNSYYMIFDAVGYETYQTPVFDFGKTTEKIVAKDIKLKKIV